VKIYPALSDEEYRWLLSQAAGILYTTAYEGFGLVPSVAIVVGAPCLFASVSSLAELFPEQAAVLTAWDAQPSDERISEVFCDKTRASEHSALLSDVASSLSWPKTPQETNSVYRKALGG